MADPITMALIGSAVLGTAGTVAETMGARNEVQAEAQIAERNAEATALQTGQAQDAQRRRNREFLARQRAAISESNIDASQGSSLLLQKQTGAELELEARNIGYSGELERLGYKTQAKMARKRKSMIGVTGFLKAGSQLLGGGATAYDYHRRLPK